MYDRHVDDGPQTTEAAVATHGRPTEAWSPGAQQTSLDDPCELIQLSGLVQQAFARAADRHDLTPVQARLLCTLAQGPRGMAELARGFGVEKAALTGLVDRAERRGLATRAAVPGDRRAVHVILTDAGLQSAAAFHTEVTSELNQLLAPLTPHHREQLRTAIAKIKQAQASGSAEACRTC